MTSSWRGLVPPQILELVGSSALKRDPEQTWVYTGEAMKIMFASSSSSSFDQGAFGWYIRTGVKIPDFNCAYIADQPNSPEKLEEIVRQYRDSGCPFLVCVAKPVAIPILRKAQDHGLVSIGDLPVMTLSPGSVRSLASNASVSVKIVRTLSELEEYKVAGTRSWGFPTEAMDRVFVPSVLEDARLRIYLAQIAHETVGICTTTFHDRNIGIWSMVTLPQHRRKGVASTLLEYLLSGSQDIDEWFLLATAEGRALYEKAGFTTASYGEVWYGG